MRMHKWHRSECNHYLKGIKEGKKESELEIRALEQLVYVEKLSKWFSYAGLFVAGLFIGSVVVAWIL